MIIFLLKKVKNPKLKNTTEALKARIMNDMEGGIKPT